MAAALILVDIQNDFLPGGALPVARGDEVVPVANRLMPQFERVIATQDWHPANHGSFAPNHSGRRVGELIELNGLAQILWPIHCVQNTFGADFAPSLRHDGITRIFRKGTDPDIDSYSGFYDNGHRRTTGLSDHLRQEGVESVYVLGLATDYCVKFTTLDARLEGLETYLVLDGCRGVDLRPGDVEQSVAEMRNAGVRITDGASLIARAASRA